MFLKKKNNAGVKYFCIILKKYVCKDDVYFTYEDIEIFHDYYRDIEIFHDYYKLEKDIILCLSKEAYKKRYVFEGK